MSVYDSLLEYHKGFLLGVIEREMAHRKPRKAEQDRWKALAGLLETNQLCDLPVFMRQMCAARNITTSRGCLRYANLFDNMLTMSLKMEKFARYAHNINLAKATKYHDQLSELQTAAMFSFSEHPERCFVRYKAEANKDVSTAGGAEVFPQNEAGYLKFCDKMQAMHKTRVKVLEETAYIAQMRPIN